MSDETEVQRIPVARVRRAARRAARGQTERTAAARVSGFFDGVSAFSSRYRQLHGEVDGVPR